MSKCKVIKLSEISLKQLFIKMYLKFFKQWSLNLKLYIGSGDGGPVRWPLAVKNGGVPVNVCRLPDLPNQKLQVFGPLKTKGGDLN